MYGRIGRQKMLAELLSQHNIYGKQVTMNPNHIGTNFDDFLKEEGTMTDKQIIDVTQCPHYKRGNVCTFLSYETKCEGECSWVTYKEMEEKLKRKEQECEELKKAYTDCAESRLIFVNKTEEFLHQLHQLTAENEELKKQNNQFDNGINEQFSKIVELEGRNNLLKVILTEIKEIAEHCIKQDICTICDYSDKCHIEDEEIPTYDVCKLILQKISECEVGNE